MADQRIGISNDTKDESYTLTYQFDDGNGNLKQHTVDILKGEAHDLPSATQIADQRAADAKQAWLDNLNLLKTVLGPVTLPTPVKADVVEASVAIDVVG